MTPSSSSEVHNQCTAQCCNNSEVAYQPKDRSTLSLVSSKQRNFQSKWFSLGYSVCIVGMGTAMAYFHWSGQGSLLLSYPVSTIGKELLRSSRYMNQVMLAKLNWAARATQLSSQLKQMHKL